MHVAFFSGFAVSRVDAYQLGTVAFSLLSAAPKMHVAGNRIATPNHDQLGFREELGLHAELAA